MDNPCEEVEALFRAISTRYIGIGSPFSTNCGTKARRALLNRIISQQNKMEHFGSKGLIHLTDYQLSSVQTSVIQKTIQMMTLKMIPKMIICGMYGTGKTVVIEFIVQRVLETISNPYIYLVAWEESRLLMERFRQRFPGSSRIKIMSGDEVCKKFGVFQEQYKHEEQRDVAINSICRKLEEECPPDHQPILLVDELPPNTNGWQADSGDWSGLRPGKVGLVLSLMPKADDVTTSAERLDITTPEDMPVVNLNRVYRYTHRILNILIFLMKNSTGEIHSPLSFPLDEVTFGNEIYGELPEVILLPGEVDLSLSSAEDLLAKNKEILFNVLEEFDDENTTILVDTCVVEEEIEGCMEWLDREVVTKNHPNIRVTTAEEFRGLESGVLIWIADRIPTWEYFDSFSRVSGHLVILYKARCVEDELRDLLEKAVQSGFAKFRDVSSLVGA